MRKSIIGAMCTCLAVVSFNINAAIVYNISTSAGAAQISGAITTDGTIGRVDIPSILDWDLFINTPLVNFQLNSTNSIISPSSYHGFDATSSELFFNHIDPWLDGVVDHLLFIENGTENMWCLDSSVSTIAGCINSPSASSVSIQEFYPDAFEFYESTNLGLEKIGTASVVPIPAAVGLFGSGLLCLTGLARRKS